EAAQGMASATIQEQWRVGEAKYLLAERPLTEVTELLGAACVAARDGDEYNRLDNCVHAMAAAARPLRHAAEKLAAVKATSGQRLTGWGSFERWASLVSQLPREAEQLEHASKQWLRDETGPERRKREGMLNQEPWYFMASMVFMEAHENRILLPSVRELH